MRTEASSTPVTGLAEFPMRMRTPTSCGGSSFDSKIRPFNLVVFHDILRFLHPKLFCQLDLRLTQDKYRGSYERCVKVIRRYSSRPGLDLSELFLRLVFCFLTGNSDMHLKNFSLIETSSESGVYVLSPAYDLLPVNVLMPEDKEKFALTMNGKKIHLRRSDFLLFAEAAGMPRKAAETMIRKMLTFVPLWQKLCDESLLPLDLKQTLNELIRARCVRLT